MSETDIPENGNSPDDPQVDMETDVQETEETADNTDGDTAGNDDTFPRSYVEELRDENAKYRQRAQRADDLAQRLHTALIASTGRLHDPEDLPFSEEHLDDPETLSAALDDLLAKKPHLASRKPTGTIGQGVSEAHATVDLAGLLRSRA